VRLLVALEPRSYRETIGGALQLLRPNLEVTILSPEVLETEVTRLEPEMVLCSLHKPAEGAGGPVWIEYCPYTAPKVTIYEPGGQNKKLDLSGLADLLAIVDGLVNRLESLVRADSGSKATNLEG
jgi:hypothetical protein